MRAILILLLAATSAAWTPNRLPATRPAPRLLAADALSTPSNQYSVFLMDDGFNMREYVERVLMMVCYLSQSDANRLMMQADWNYSAKIGTWEQPVAEHVLQGLRKAGLSAAIQPVEPELEL